jgi:hypothetical protein
MVALIATGWPLQSRHPLSAIVLLRPSPRRGGESGRPRLRTDIPTCPSSPESSPDPLFVFWRSCSAARTHQFMDEEVGRAKVLCLARSEASLGGTPVLLCSTPCRRSTAWALFPEGRTAFRNAGTRAGVPIPKVPLVQKHLGDRGGQPLLNLLLRRLIEHNKTQADMPMRSLESELDD